MVLVLSPVSGQPNEVLELATLGQSTQLVQTREIDDPELSGWVWIERYLPAAGGDLRGAIVLATTEHGLPGTTYVLPAGTYQWPGAPFAPANNTTWIGYGCTIERDMAGVASGQIFFFLRTDTGAGHADRIHFIGGVFRLLNVDTSFFSAAIQFEAASNCVIEKCTAQCTLIPTATAGRIRWGFNLLGGNLSLGQGMNNRFESNTLDFAQIQGCASGRSAYNILVKDTIVENANDLAVSVVSTGATQTLENVTISHVDCRNVAGSGVVLAGSDGSGIGFGCGLVRNLLVEGVQLSGQRSTPNLAFEYSIAVSIHGGLVTENVTVNNVGTKLTPNASAQARSVLCSSQDDEVSWSGLTISNCNLGTVTSNDPLEGLFISGKNISRCTITNITVFGPRGVQIRNVDQLALSNVECVDGGLTVRVDRDLDVIQIANCRFVRTTGVFSNGVLFQSTSGRSCTNVELVNVVIGGTGNGLNTALAGGSMQMSLSNVTAAGGLTPETLAGIKRYKNVIGFAVLATVSVVVPAVAAGSVGYVDVSMAGTRLSDLTVGEPVVANPTADLVAAGVGGAYVAARVSALGTVRMAFLGPLAGGAVNFNFDRAN